MKSDRIGMKLPQINIIRSLWVNVGYKYLRVLQDNRIMDGAMRKTAIKEYKKTIRKALETILNGASINKAIIHGLCKY